LDDYFSLEDLYEEVVIIKNRIEEEKETTKDKLLKRKEKRIRELEAQVEELKNKLIEIGITEKSINKYENKELSTKDMRIQMETKMIEYFRDFFRTCNEFQNFGEYWYLSRDLYELYKNYIIDRYSTIYLITYTKFNYEVLKCPCINNNRITLKRDDPRYIFGADNRLTGKMVTVDEGFVEYFKF
jgi:hypothetical protein